MTAHPIAPIAAASTPAASNGRPWVLALGGMVIGSVATLAVYAIATAPAGLVMGMAWQQAAPSSNIILAFDSAAPAAHTQILRGVSGETTTSTHPATEAELISPAAVLARNYEIAPAAWDRLSAGDCIALTTASGQKLSFRILGAQKAEAARNRPGSSNLELAVTACAPGSEVILKAVIETRTEGKESAVQRAL